jgi:hypothetical protein
MNDEGGMKGGEGGRSYTLGKSMNYEGGRNYTLGKSMPYEGGMKGERNLASKSNTMEGEVKESYAARGKVTRPVSNYSQAGQL